MADAVSGFPDRGKTYHGPNKTLSTTYTIDVGIEGATKQFDDLDYGAQGVKTRRSNRQVTCMLVRNVATVSLLPKRTVRWASGQRGKRVDGYAFDTDLEVAGVVDEFLPVAGVRQHDLFWLAVAGPSLCLMNLAQTTDVSMDDVVGQMAAASSQALTAGRVRQFNLTSNATFAVSRAMHKIGRAMSTVASTPTGADVLVDLELIKT
jgi:hypothetical protein